MPDYSLGKIYMVYPKVEDAGEGDVYYGSTTETLSRRMAKHRAQSCCKILFDKYGVENCFIELVEEYPCDTKDELTKKEGQYIRDNLCVNKVIAGRTRKEHYVDNRDKLKEHSKQYKNDNPDKVKQYLTENTDKIKEQMKHYRTKNADKIKEQAKHYRTKNRDKIKELNNQKANCPHCNKELIKHNISRHIKSGYCHNLPQSIHTIDQVLD